MGYTILMPHLDTNIHNPTTYDPETAGYALIDGLHYLKDRLQWSGSKIAKILHIPANTLNTWLKNGYAPLHGRHLSPEIQAVIHLLAIHRSLEAMFESPEIQVAWLTTHHPELDTEPLTLMSRSVEGLIFVRQYLDYVRGRGA